MGGGPGGTSVGSQVFRSCISWLLVVVVVGGPPYYTVVLGNHSQIEVHGEQT